MMLSTQNRRDPYDIFKQWCLVNGFSDIINCKSKDVNLHRLGQAINQHMPFQNGRHQTTRGSVPLSRRGHA